MTSNTGDRGHTPGPFNIYRDEDGNAISVLKYVEGNGGGTTGKSLCRMPIPSRKLVHKNAATDWEEINANALLFAAAPELLEAVHNAIALWAFSSTDAPQLAWLEQAKCAIAKAEGKL